MTISRYYPSTYLEVPRNITEYLTQDNLFQFRDSKSHISEYEAENLTTR